MSPSNDNLPIQYVYVISTVKDGQHVAPIKIGQTKSVRSRLRSLQTGSPFELEVTFAFPIQGYDFADALEGICHRVAKEYRLKGEWFDLHPHKGLQLVCAAITTVCQQAGRSGADLIHDLTTLGILAAYHEARKRWPDLVDGTQVQ